MTDNGLDLDKMRTHLDELVDACRTLHREMRPWIMPMRGQRDPLEALYYLGGSLLMHCTSALALIDRGLWGDARAIVRSMFETQWLLMYFSLGSVPELLAEVGLNEADYRADIAAWLDGGKIEAVRLRRMATLQNRSGARRYLDDIYADYSGYVHSSRRSATADMSRDNLRYWYDGKPDYQKYKKDLMPDVLQSFIDAVPSLLSAIHRCLSRNGAAMDADALTAAGTAYVRLADLLAAPHPAAQRRRIVDTYADLIRPYGFLLP